MARAMACTPWTRTAEPGSSGIRFRGALELAFLAGQPPGTSCQTGGWPMTNQRPSGAAGNSISGEVGSRFPEVIYEAQELTRLSSLSAGGGVGAPTAPLYFCPQRFSGVAGANIEGQNLEPVAPARRLPVSAGGGVHGDTQAEVARGANSCGYQQLQCVAPQIKLIAGSTPVRQQKSYSPPTRRLPAGRRAFSEAA